MILDFHFSVAADPQKGYGVTLHLDREELARGKFDFRANGAAVAPELEEIAEGNPTRDTLTHVGTELWHGLVDQELLKVFESKFNQRQEGTDAILRLSLPPELRALPWESMYYRQKGFLSGLSGCALVHTPSEQFPTKFPDVNPKRGPLRMLIIVPERSKIDVQPERESILSLFRNLPGSVAEVIDGRVTPDRLHEKLSEQWDIVHFIGHGGVNQEGRAEIYLNAENGTPQSFDGEDFAASVREAAPRLVVMNSCKGSAGWDAAGLTGFGPLLMRAGVPAVIAMQYPIGNDMASQFARSFYEYLFCRRSPGRVDRAFEETRAALRRIAGPDTQRAYVTPVLHLAHGFAHLFEISPTRVIVTPERPQETPPSVNEPLPERLVLALQQKRCVPVIGAGVLRVSALRDKAAGIATPFGPRELAEYIAQHPSHAYPRMQADLSLCENAEWMHAHFLQWVSQHAESKDDGRGDLITAIQQHYASTPAPSLVREIANWKVPLAFYLHFDTYLEQLVLNGEAWLDNVVYEFDKPLPIVQQPGQGPRSLVLVRGSCTKSGLVLTEEDHDELAERIGKMNERLQSAAKSAGSSVLFIGVNPRDPVVRQLSQKILDAGSKRLQGPTYFCCPNHDDVDMAYWRRFGVKWLKQDTPTLVRQINAVMNSI